MEAERRLHVVLIPWLAMGHTIPFFELAKCLARKGIHISFISTPGNIERLPKVPSGISSLINLVKFPLPLVENLPEHAESTTDLPADKVHYLKKAFDGLQGPSAAFLEKSVPSWIIYDFAVHWLPPIANRLGVPCAFLSLFSALLIGYSGPPSLLMGSSDEQTMERVLSVPNWVPFPCNVVPRLHEILRYAKTITENAADVTESYRFGSSANCCDVVFVRSCREFESDWLRVVEDAYQRPVIPVGLLPPSIKERSDENCENWRNINEWLDKQKQEEVVYVAVGTEAALSQEEFTELALGLELSQVPFFWVIRKLPSLCGQDPTILPDGFKERISGRAYICEGWAPQVKILAHPSVGGFLTHCGWNSVIESLGFGRVLILLPFLAEQGLNARVLEEKKLGLEIPRDEQDGSFTRDAVAESIRASMVDEGSDTFRTNAKAMREIFGNHHLHDGYIDKLAGFLYSYKHRKHVKSR